ncbi:nucleotidyltransferase domain-containing protein [Paenibacillus protaetiae]|uniref:Polymerase nucleotidyl transferase domain-containing protein n=1 Tax=Paenibacillus protaetiae TaxID=2509456 RepID=A0A4V0YFK2_9BACL|nr:nucleotidyltransferase domain-containing protein [Paenibacillus protaetiae]QAY68001.1 hypothetical protein ET464_18100 [Paenibacillus protaetiae]
MFKSISNRPPEQSARPRKYKNNLPLDSVYVYGSVALGGFIEGTSDIDFIAIFSRPPAKSDIPPILAAHKEVENEFPHTDIMELIFTETISENRKKKLIFLITY